jgi:hypothetical protein
LEQPFAQANQRSPQGSLEIGLGGLENTAKKAFRDGYRVLARRLNPRRRSRHNRPFLGVTAVW